MTYEQLKEIYQHINSWLADGMTQYEVAKFLMKCDYEAETAFWLIDKAIAQEAK